MLVILFALTVLAINFYASIEFFRKLLDINRRRTSLMSAQTPRDHNEYHGIIINLSQKDRSIFGKLEIIGRKRVLLGLITLYKIKVAEHDIKNLISEIQHNMSRRLLFKRQEYYAHFYRNNELIIAYRNKTFNVSPDKKTWAEAVGYGLQLHIAEKQLDFTPNRFEDETY
jgi:hypothetical protein